MPFKRLAELKLVMFPGDHQCCRLIDRFCGEKGFRIRPHLEATTLSTLLQMVKSGRGACVLPLLLLDNLNDGDIRTIRLTHPTPSQDICLIYRSDRYVGYAMRTFIRTLRQFIETAMLHASAKSS